MKANGLKRAALCVALGACLGSLLPTAAFAQAVSGAVAGRASAGDQITVVSTSTGQTRTVTASADGSYRLGQLPVGDYQLQLSRDGQKLGEPVAVSVAIETVRQVERSPMPARAHSQQGWHSCSSRWRNNLLTQA